MRGRRGWGGVWGVAGALLLSGCIFRGTGAGRAGAPTAENAPETQAPDPGSAVVPNPVSSRVAVEPAGPPPPNTGTVSPAETAEDIVRGGSGTAGTAAGGEEEPGPSGDGPSAPRDASVRGGGGTEGAGTGGGGEAGLEESGDELDRPVGGPGPLEVPNVPRVEPVPGAVPQDSSAGGEALEEDGKPPQ